MKGKKNNDGSYTLENGTLLSEADFNAQLTEADKEVEEVPNWAMAMAQTQERERLIRENEEFRRKEAERNNAPPAPVNFAPGEPFSDPNKFYKAIEDLVTRQVAPLHAEREQYAKERAYAQAKKALLAKNQQFAQQFQTIEHLVDGEMAGKDPTEANIVKSIQTVVGAIYLSNPSAFQQPPNNNSGNPPPTPAPRSNNQPPVNNNLPPHLQPSRSTLPPNGNDPFAEPSDDEFDENERRLMRERGMNKMQWKVLRTIPPNKLGKKMYDAIKTNDWKTVKEMGGM